LIHRSKNGVRLTYFGHRVYEDAKLLINSMRSCESNWRGLLAERNELSGRVSIQCTPGAEAYLSEIIVPELREAYPGIELLITPSQEMREGFQHFVKSGCTLGIGACLSEAWDTVRAQVEEEGLVCEFFGSERPQILLSSRNPFAQEEYLTREQLAELELVCFTFAPLPRILSLFRGMAARVPNKESLVRLVAHSDSAGFFAPASIRRELSELRNKVRLIPLGFQDESIMPIMHYLIHAPESELALHEKRTLELLRHYPYTD
ncbi:MAG: LysR family transcriptional regulator, partial [Oscillospiraceae bacterium]|nr:LysR family transcriptional regulator [Oscillospiraceae bacterium]